MATPQEIGKLVAFISARHKPASLAITDCP